MLVPRVRDLRDYRFLVRTDTGRKNCPRPPNMGGISRRDHVVEFTSGGGGDQLEQLKGTHHAVR